VTGVDNFNWRFGITRGIILRVLQGTSNLLNKLISMEGWRREALVEKQSHTRMISACTTLTLEPSLEVS
jgi:hypothetical protein